MRILKELWAHFAEVRILQDLACKRSASVLRGAKGDFSAESTEFAEDEGGSEKRRPREGEDWVGEVVVGRSIGNDSPNSYYLSIDFLFTSSVIRTRSPGFQSRHGKLRR